MANLYFFIAFFFCCTVYAQVFDDFSTGDIAASGLWQGDVSHFKVNSSYQLQLNQEGVGESQIYAPVSFAQSMEWSFLTKISFNTSSNNNMRLYLAADSAYLKNAPNSICLKFGEDNDKVQLVFKQNGLEQKVFTLDSITTDASVNMFQFYVFFDTLFQWRIKIYNSMGAVVYNDTLMYNYHFPLLTHAGIYCKYTSSNAKKIYFDDIYIGSIRDFKVSQRDSPIHKNDVLISEVLFNPEEGCVDFVELYNNTDRDIDLQGLRLSNRYETSGLLKEVVPITSKEFIVPAFSYVLLSVSSVAVKQCHAVLHEIQAIDMHTFPSFNNERGFVVLTDENANVIDELFYNEQMHHPLLLAVKGVSLERVSFLKDVEATMLWHSAAAINSYATPGYANSQQMQTAATHHELTFAYTTFTPNMDGERDFLPIQYHFKQEGMMGDVYIYNANGTLVRRLVEGEQIGVEGTLLWDGRDQNAALLSSGIYIVYANFFHINGLKYTAKKAVVLTID